ncbi:hypothetical protein BDZ89DRAFT_1042349 [Hymenopellis radicata]|nr:hypothetical protein BDZ89DRAFT_1042349 [Hymenopellis radicata]
MTRVMLTRLLGNVVVVVGIRLGERAFKDWRAGHAVASPQTQADVTFLNPSNLGNDRCAAPMGLPADASYVPRAVATLGIHATAGPPVLTHAVNAHSCIYARPICGLCLAKKAWDERHPKPKDQVQSIPKQLYHRTSTRLVLPMLIYFSKTSGPGRVGVSHNKTDYKTSRYHIYADMNTSLPERLRRISDDYARSSTCLTVKVGGDTNSLDLVGSEQRLPCVGNAGTTGVNDGLLSRTVRARARLGLNVLPGRKATGHWTSDTDVFKSISVAIQSTTEPSAGSLSTPRIEAGREVAGVVASFSTANSITVGGSRGRSRYSTIRSTELGTSSVLVTIEVSTRPVHRGGEAQGTRDTQTGETCIINQDGDRDKRSDKDTL